MPRKSNFDPEPLVDLLARQHGVVSRSQALGLGLSAEAVRWRVRAGGPWRPILPGVYLASTGVATADQRDMAGLLYAGPRSVLTGLAALRRHRLRLPDDERLDLLIPAAARRASVSFVRVHRSTRLPQTVCQVGPLSYVLPDRAVADAVRGMADIREVRAVVAAVVQRDICPVPLLARELDAGPVRGSAPFRQALGEVAEGVRSSAEGDMRDLIRRARLPTPLFNPKLFVGGEFLACPDCWWPDAGVAAEVDSREWHLSPAAWEETLARHARMSAHGLIVLHFTPRQVRAERDRVAVAIRRALESAGGRAPLPIRTVPA